MINAREARAEANANAAEAARKKEAHIESQWEIWGPKVESAIEAAVECGGQSVEVDINVSYTEMKGLDDMVRKHIHSLGYKTEFKWHDRNVYRLNIYWHEGGCSK